IDREELPLRHSLISQIIKQLSAGGKLTAIKPLANRDGCINTIATLIGELQRAGKTADEFHVAIAECATAQAEPTSKSLGSKSQVSSLKSQLDFDRDVALIYETYTRALDRFDLTDDDADQLRALQIMRGDVAQVGNLRSKENSQDDNLRHPAWLDQIDLLVLDGFFDFTPVQGEMLKVMIPNIPNVIVNLNHDQQKEDIFRPVQPTLDQLNW